MHAVPRRARGLAGAGGQAAALVSAAARGGPLRGRATLIEHPRIERLALRDLPDARYAEYTTLVIPPLGELEADPLRYPRHGRPAADSPATTH
ncbi:MAG: hypothetical protein MZW92_80950 [Comamonadaceae bacterium]|nr:hypothetical protein [Comamonadaceae bacterium]